MRTQRWIRTIGLGIVLAGGVLLTGTGWAADLDASTTLSSATVAIPLQGGTQNVTKQATNGTWTGYWDFGDKNGNGVRDDAVAPGGLNMAGYYLLHNTSGSSGNSQSIRLNMNGGGVTATTGYINTDASKTPGNIFIYNVADIAMGDGYLSSQLPLDTVAYAAANTWEIRVGQPSSTAGNVQIARIDFSRVKDNVGGNGVYIYGGGDVLIKNRGADGTINTADDMPGNITIGATNTVPPISGTGEAAWNKLEVHHHGNFLAGSIYGIIKGYGAVSDSNTSDQKAIAFYGWFGGSGTPTGTFQVDRIDTEAIIKTGTSKQVNAPSIQISHYQSVTIGDIITDAWDGGGSGNNGGTSGSLTVTDINGDIRITNSISLNAETVGTTKDGTLSLACTGTVTLAQLDMNKVRFSKFTSGSGKSYITGALANFAVAGNGAAGTPSDPILTAQTNLCAAAGQRIYYTPVANDYLGGKVYRIADLNMTAAQGGLLMPESVAGTLIQLR